MQRLYIFIYNISIKFQYNISLYLYILVIMLNLAILLLQCGHQKYSESREFKYLYSYTPRIIMVNFGWPSKMKDLLVMFRRNRKSNSRLKYCRPYFFTRGINFRLEWQSNFWASVFSTSGMFSAGRGGSTPAQTMSLNFPAATHLYLKYNFLEKNLLRQKLVCPQKWLRNVPTTKILPQIYQSEFISVIPNIIKLLEIYSISL